MEVHRSARKHGIGDDAAIAHAVDHALVVVDLEPDADPPRVLAIGPDEAGNLSKSSGWSSPTEHRS